MSSDPLEIHVIADATGDTAARVARAAQVQFTTHPVRIVRHPRIMTADGLRRVFQGLDHRPGVAVYSTLVDDGLRELVTELCHTMQIPHADLLGPAMEALEAASGDRAERVPARLVGMDADYFKRIAAMEYAVKNDDGQFLDGLDDADIVLIGVSRTGKTPLSMYLGYLGHKTANIPLVPGIPPPSPLFAIDRRKIIGLTIDPQRLAAIRGRRVKALGVRSSKDGYAELNKIYDELDEIRAIQRRLGCPVIDTTNVALEEAAGRVIELIEERRITPVTPIATTEETR
ncbi:MAG: kinase/pyrophosphorylase [Actinomycetota bacterium]|nr:kinase/pyrophosphorylase [Actinomycetota bacterium]